MQRGEQGNPQALSDADRQPEHRVAEQLRTNGLEQMEGQAVKESDFFAVGRTFVHLLTGIYPAELPKNLHANQLIWRDRAPQISEWLVYLINELIAPLPQNRPRNSQRI